MTNTPQSPRNPRQKRSRSSSMKIALSRGESLRPSNEQSSTIAGRRRERFGRRARQRHTKTSRIHETRRNATGGTQRCGYRRRHFAPSGITPPPLPSHQPLVLEVAICQHCHVLHHPLLEARQSVLLRPRVCVQEGNLYRWPPITGAGKRRQNTREHRLRIRKPPCFAHAQATPGAIWRVSSVGLFICHTSTGFTSCVFRPGVFNNSPDTIMHCFHMYGPKEQVVSISLKTKAPFNFRGHGLASFSVVPQRLLIVIQVFLSTALITKPQPLLPSIAIIDLPSALPDAPSGLLPRNVFCIVCFTLSSTFRQIFLRTSFPSHSAR